MSPAEHRPPADQGRPGPSRRGHEERDVSFRPVIASGIALFALAALAFVGMRVLFSHFADRERQPSPPANPLATRYGRGEPPAPRLQTDPVEDLRRLRADEDSLLHGYAWIDRPSRVVRIPVERALALLAERGLPVRPEAGEDIQAHGEARDAP